MTRDQLYNPEILHTTKELADLDIELLKGLVMQEVFASSTVPVYGGGIDWNSAMWLCEQMRDRTSAVLNGRDRPDLIAIRFQAALSVQLSWTPNGERVYFPYSFLNMEPRNILIAAIVAVREPKENKCNPAPSAS